MRKVSDYAVVVLGRRTGPDVVLFVALDRRIRTSWSKYIGFTLVPILQGWQISARETHVL